MTATEHEVALGILQHLSDDDWFHTTLGFSDITGRMAAFNQLSVLFKSAEYEPSAALNMAWLEIQG